MLPTVPGMERTELDGSLRIRFAERTTHKYKPPMGTARESSKLCGRKGDP